MTKKITKNLSVIIAVYIVATCFAVISYGVVIRYFSGSPFLNFMIITICLMAIFIGLTYIFIKKVYKPLVSIEKAMTLLKEGSTDFDVDFDEGGDDYLLSIQLKEMLKNVKASMDRAYAAGILIKQAEINALQSQINPHFLYNVLDSIRGHALMEGVDEIAEMTEALSTLFRYSISNSNNLVTIESEIKNIKNYFKIQQYRFNNKFDLNIKIDGDPDIILSYKLPKLTIQPILENSIYHGLEMKVDRGKIDVRIESTQDRLIIIISDDGVGMDKQQLERLNNKLNRQINKESEIGSARKTGIALSNVNQRIKMLFGEEYGLYVSSTPNIGTDVEIVMPIVTDNEL